MSNSDTINMPERLDFKASAKFNADFDLALNAVSSNTKLIKLDFSLLDYMDSAGIGLLVISYKKAQKANVNMSIHGAKKNTQELLKMANLQKLIKIN